MASRRSSSVKHPARSPFLLLALLAAACATDRDTRQTDASVAGEWSPGTSLPVARFEAYGAVAHDRIHFIGGITGVYGDIRTALPSRRIDVFDPVTSTWTTGPDLPADAPKHHLSVTVANDAIYVLGGFDGILGQNGMPFVPVAVAYVLEGNTWRKLSAPPLARGGATAQAIQGKIYVTGGAPNEGEPSFDELDVYDIATDRWSTAAPLPTAREHVASCAIDGKLIVVGGWAGAQRAAVAKAEEYDPATNRWTALPDMSVPRGGLGATVIDGRCHVVGGEDWALPLPGTFAAHEVLDPISRTWTKAPPMPTARHGLGIAWLAGALYAVGGGPIQGNSYTEIVEVFRP